MSRPVGQVGAWKALRGLLFLVLAVSGIVGLCDWLVPPGTATLPLEAPVEDDPTQPGVVVCPAALERPAPVPVVSSELFDCPDLYDGARVAYTGEVIQAVLPRDRRAWVQLNDDVYALGVGPIATHRTALGGNAGVPVSIPIEVAQDIQHVGDGAGSGDVIEVVGTFLRADPADGGGPTIQAEQATIVSRGARLSIPAETRRIVVAGLLVLLTAALGAAVAVRRRM